MNNILGVVALPSFLPNCNCPTPPSLCKLQTSSVLPSSIVKSSNSTLLDAVPTVRAPAKLPDVSLPIKIVKSLKLSLTSSLVTTLSITKLPTPCALAL